MLEEFKYTQGVAYGILNNAVINNKLSHAYLFECNDNPDSMKLAISFAKLIICNDLSESEKNSICKRIDEGNYFDIRIIESENLWIRKEDIINLQNEFSKKAIEGKRKIYIIKEAEKMNVQTSNCILKFLEEPVDDIIAILLVNNINLMLATIISRCQVVNLNKKKYTMSSVDNFFYLFSNSKYGKISIDEANNIIKNVIEFSLFVERDGLNAIIYSKKIWHDYFKDRESNVLAIELLINFYMDVIRYKNGLNINFFCDKVDFINEVSICNGLDILTKKINILIEAKNNLLRNLNINLLIDKLIIDMCGD